MNPSNKLISLLNNVNYFQLCSTFQNISIKKNKHCIIIINIWGALFRWTWDLHCFALTILLWPLFFPFKFYLITFLFILSFICILPFFFCVFTFDFSSNLRDCFSSVFLKLLSIFIGRNNFGLSFPSHFCSLIILSFIFYETH